MVDNDGDAAYASIQVAVDNASTGDIVRVRPGTYREQVTIGKNITLVAPDGATLAGGQFERLSHGIRIQPGVVPVIEGFTIRNYTYGVNAERAPRMGVSDSDWETGWVVRNVTFVGCSEEAIRAGNSMADWTVENVSIDGQGGFVGITAFGSLGDWTVRNTVIRSVEFDAIDGGTGGNWTIRNTSIADTKDGIDVGRNDGNGTILDTTVRNVQSGLILDKLSGTVTVTDTVVANVSHPADDPRFNGVAVYAANTDGDWRIRDSVIRNYSRYGINATGASPAGDVTENWWGHGGPSDNTCRGNVLCTDALKQRPNAGAILSNPGAPVPPQPQTQAGSNAKTTTATTATATAQSTTSDSTIGTGSDATVTAGQSSVDGTQSRIPLVAGSAGAVVIVLSCIAGLWFLTSRE